MKIKLDKYQKVWYNSDYKAAKEEHLGGHRQDNYDSIPSSGVPLRKVVAPLVRVGWVAEGPLGFTLMFDHYILSILKV